MLACEDFCGCHEGDLSSLEEDLEAACDGNEGFPRSYISFEEATHGVGIFHVFEDLEYGDFLCIGWSEWEA